jgi:hypothetical protein
MYETILEYAIYFMMSVFIENLYFEKIGSKYEVEKTKHSIIGELKTCFN